MVDILFYPPYIVTYHVVMRAAEGASGSKGRSRKSPLFYIYLKLMAPDKPINVEIYKQTYQLRASEGRDAEYIQRAAAYLDQKMQQAAAEVGNRAPLDIAILAALNIAEEVLSARQQKETLLDQADAHIDSFTQLLSDADPPEDPPTNSKRF